MKSRFISLVALLSLTAIFFSLASKYVPNPGGSSAWGDDDKLSVPKSAMVTTLITTPRRVFALTGDNHRNLYTGGAGTPPCPIFQINIHKPSLIPVGFVVPAVGNCGFIGVAFTRKDELLVVDGGGDPPSADPAGTIYTFKPNAKNPPIATIFGSGVPGTFGGIALDKKG